MHRVPHWQGTHTIEVAESLGGVLATVDPADNLIRRPMPWPPPELLQKLYASSRFRGRTPEDDEAATRLLGHYSDLQSLNSEDAVTWSFFGNLAYAPAPERMHVLNEMLARIGLPPEGEPPVCWVWRRIPHPEKPASSGGPEIDFGFLTSSKLVLGEAKWNSKLAGGQGVDGNRNQLYLRAAYCDRLAPKALPTVRRFVVLGVGRTATVFDGSDPGPGTRAVVAQLSWGDVVGCFPAPLASALCSYLVWKSEHSSSRAA